MPSTKGVLYDMYTRPTIMLPDLTPAQQQRARAIVAWAVNNIPACCCVPYTIQDVVEHIARRDGNI